MNIGFAIRRVRQLLDFSQESLSKKTGLSQTSISQIENGVKTPSKKSIEKICKAMKVPEDILYILGIQGDEIPVSRRDAYEQLYPPMENFAIQFLQSRKKSETK